MTYYFFILAFFISGCDSKNQTEKIKNYDAFHTEAMTFVQNKNMNSDFYYLLDFNIHSGKNRFFVVDLKSKKIIDAAIVTHGSCDVFSNNSTKHEKAKFSNEENSHCSSIGKYKIGSRDKSSWGIGIKYWLHGLESTNKNATKRVVVLHSWSAVSEEEIFPNHSPLSWGCPAVSDTFMTKIDDKLNGIDKPVLMWIIE